VQPNALVIGRYLLHRPIARGGMATIHLAHLVGDVGFSRIVAAKRLHPELAKNGEVVAMFLDEARVASKVHHRNVVPVLDVVTADGEVVLVQEYVRGAPLSRLLQIAADAGSHVPVPVAAAIACGVLAGLHAAHETVDEMGEPLHVVHRDVSPQNILVATDGAARLVDFGVAKAAAAAHVTRKSTFKGKLAYSAPEHIRGKATHQSDIFSLSIVLWELVTGHRLNRASLGVDKLVARIVANELPTPTEELADQRAMISGYRWQQIAALEPIVMKGLAADPSTRWRTAQEMEEAVAAAVPIATAAEVAEWLANAARDFLEERERMIAEDEAAWRGDVARAASPKLGDLSVPVQIASEHGERRAWSRWLAIAGATAAVTGIVLALALGRDDRPAMALQQLAPPPAAAAPTPPPPPSVPEPLAPERATCAPPVVATPRPPVAVKRAPAVVAAPKRIVRAGPRSALAPPPPPVPAKAPPAAAKTPAVDCNPPYYFQGAKKVFKPACV